MMFEWKSVNEFPIELANKDERYKTIEIIVSDGKFVSVSEFKTGYHKEDTVWWKFEDSDKLEFAVTKWMYLPLP